MNKHIDRQRERRTADRVAYRGLLHRGDVEDAHRCGIGELTGAHVEDRVRRRGARADDRCACSHETAYRFRQSVGRRAYHINDL